MDVKQNQYILGNDLAGQIFINLMSNSIRHNSKEKKWVRISATEDPNELLWSIIVEDNADGIEERVKEKIFERYARFSRKEGLGLGMSIVKALVDVMGGSIEVENRVPGKQDEGSRFIVHLPKA